MERQHIREVFINTLKRYAKDQSVFENLSDESEIREHLKINSARIVDIVLDLEETFGIELDDKDMDSLWTIGESLDTFERLINEKE